MSNKKQTNQPAEFKEYFLSITSGFYKMVQSSAFLSNFVTVFLIFLLMFCMFVIGSLWTRVTFYEKNPGTGLSLNNGSPAQPSLPTAPVPNPASLLSNLTALAEKSGVNAADFDECFDSGEFKQKVIDQTNAGASAGVAGTPAGFIVRADNGKILQVPGAVPYATLKQYIDKMLNGTVTDQELFTGELPALSDSDHRLGPSNAKLVLIEYSDYECSFCARFHPTMKQAMEEYENELAWVYRHFPLDQIHPNARPAAEASECVAKLGGNEAFWKFTDAAFGL